MATRRKKDAPAAEAETAPAEPVVTKDLQIRYDGKVVFSQAVLPATFDLGFKGGNLSVTAAIADASELPEPIGIPVDAETLARVLGEEPPVHDEDAPNPDVNLRIHSGRRPAQDDQVEPPDPVDAGAEGA
jgi:hypothetical protein